MGSDAASTTPRAPGSLESHEVYESTAQTMQHASTVEASARSFYGPSSARHSFPDLPTEAARWQPQPHETRSSLGLFRRCLALNVVQRTISAAVLAPLVTYFLWQSPAFATATVCSCLQSLCSYEFAWLAHRINHRLLHALQLHDSHTPSTGDASASTASMTHDPDYRDDPNEATRRLLAHGSEDALAMLQASRSSLSLSQENTPTMSERPLLETPPETPETHPSPRPRRSDGDERDHHDHDEPSIDPNHYAISSLAARISIHRLQPYRLVREWIAALLVTAVVATVSSLLFLLAINEWLPELAPMEIYDYRGFYAGVTNGIGMLCACFTPNWRYATIVFGENIVFTILTMYSTVCPINQLSCGIALEPLQVQLASVGCLLVLRFTTSRSAPEALLLFILDSLGFLYIVGSLTVLVGFVDDDKRALYRQLLIVLLYVTWASDTGAYVTGKLLALCRYPYYHPLAAHLSKNKDYEGTLGAVLWGLAAMFGASHVLSVDGSPWTKTAFTIIGVVIGRFGDLFESLLKRAAGVKDSGTLIPGHGGVLDRIDALMFITLVFARYYALVLDDSNKQEEANLG